MCPQSASRKCWLFADVFWKPSILSAALALGNTSFLSLSLNLNCKGSAFSQGTGAEGHCGVLGRISQVSTPHPWSPPSGWSGSHFPHCSHVVSLPWECCLSAATPGADGTNVFWTTGKGGVQGWMLLPCFPAGGAGDRVPHLNCLFVLSLQRYHECVPCGECMLSARLCAKFFT